MDNESFLERLCLRAAEVDLLADLLRGAAGLEERDDRVQLRVHELLAVAVQLSVAERDAVADLVGLLERAA